MERIFPLFVQTTPCPLLGGEGKRSRIGGEMDATQKEKVTQLRGAGESRAKTAGAPACPKTQPRSCSAGMKACRP